MFALKGKREYQEDCGAAIELGNLLVLAVADGFNKPEERGSDVSSTVLRTVLRAVSSDTERLNHDPTAFMIDTFAHVHDATKHYIAGSTLSLVIIDRTSQIATLGYVGDSVIALTDSSDNLHIHPYEQMQTRDRGLTSAFGDCVNAALRDNTPHIVQHTLGPDSILIVSSDGLYPITPENDLTQLEFLARHYISMIREGGTPQKLAEYASVSELSPDNITVAVYQAER